LWDNIAAPYSGLLVARFAHRVIDQGPVTPTSDNCTMRCEPKIMARDEFTTRHLNTARRAQPN